MYDTAGRLTTLTDYDNAALSYTYDNAGRALSMTDYHNNATSYTYSSTGRLSTLTAPGNKTWTYTYNGIGQPTQVAIPNGMTTAYTYDNRNRLTQIQHKDGATALDSFNYTLDAQGNITHTAQVDGSYWDYTYDDRYRLTQADRFSSASGNVKAHYAYTYDAADNMTAKVEPFKDDFSDGNYTGWAPYPTNGWGAANGYMQNTTAAGWSWYSRAQTDPSVDVQLSYRLDSGTQRMYVRPRQMNNANSDRVELVVYPTWMWLRQFVGGVMTDFGTWSTASTAGSWYDLRVECDGANVNVWKGPKGGTMDLVKQVSTCTVTTTDSLMFITVDSQWSFDDIRVLSDSLSANTTLTYDNANELTSTTTDGATTSYTYDAHGRMTAKTWGSYSATYAYRYGDKLTAVTSNFPGEGNVTYEYGGDSHRRERNDGAATKYRWDDGWSVVEEENSTGALTMTYIGGQADVPGSSPATGSYRYYSIDRIGSTRGLRDQSKASIGQYENTPYGASFYQRGAGIAHTFTGHDWDVAAQLYYTVFRYYSPQLSRWYGRDRLGMVDGPNLYSYARMQPVSRVDFLGLSTVGLPPHPFPSSPPQAAIPRPVFDGGNPHLHCVNSCVLAALVGDGGAEWADDTKEVMDGFWCLLLHHKAHCCSAYQESDYRDNAKGRACAHDSCYKGVNRCIDCCTAKGVGPGTPEGTQEGSTRPCGPLDFQGNWGVPY